MKLLRTAACLLLCAPAFAQDIRSYVQATTARVATLDATSDDYADLAAVGQAIGEARVVMLGEQDHGDGPVFQTKTPLVKHLHERKGFAVLAFESDFYGLATGWDQLAKQPDSIRHFLQQNIFLNWANSADCRYLFQQYIPQSFQTSSPLPARIWPGCRFASLVARRVYPLKKRQLTGWRFFNNSWMKTSQTAGLLCS